MPTRKVGKDARRRTVSIDDYVIDRRGRAYTISWTEKPFRKQKTARALSAREDDLAGSYVYINLREVFRVRQSGTRRANKARWRRLYDKYVRPTKRQEARKRRKAAASTKMWPCPVCMNGRQPTRFKIGVQVWSGKRLRVCSTPCKRRVLREVRELQQSHRGSDPERARRQIAWRYMKAGGQI